MMIAARFKTIVWVACVAVAALGCYLVSLKVAAERAQMARLDRHLMLAQSDIRQLSTELGTRSRLVQLERWNADVLALTAPKAAQYLNGEMQLASLAAPGADQGVPTTPAAAALQAPPAVAQVAYTPVEKPASGLLHSVSLDLDEGAQPVLRHAALVRPRGAALVAPQRVAYLGKTDRP
ncbi:hypothetical protein [Sphingomonas morindae]|uniref:Uncharacterized protein n=1 Tax=Sphingomonas morindae TaxID=1541170 RepID=A0ABY4X9X3_9SPHN|nr:hypothetical protein [Sphingomonas morindae]USI73639.1 hypothetical protein LHA26_03970 [Sphingomonas morindae]